MCILKVWVFHGVTPIFNPGSPWLSWLPTNRTGVFIFSYVIFHIFGHQPTQQVFSLLISLLKKNFNIFGHKPTEQVFSLLLKETLHIFGQKPTGHIFLAKNQQARRCISAIVFITNIVGKTSLKAYDMKTEMQEISEFF